CALAAALLAVSLPAPAQTTNAEVYQQLAVQCLGAVPGTAQALRLEAPGQMPYLRAALVQHWAEEGRALYLADSAAALPHLRYAIEEVGVAYAREGRRRLRRAVTLALRYTFTGPDGRLLHDDRCRDTFTDTLPRAARAAVEDAAYPETQGEAPPAGWRRRYLEPALLLAATAVTVALFFNLRGERSSDV
ncbi:MAG: hypothetical protein R3362_10690, partial [Rhodothermales bacterium]|nr:hypothetical protein [Rhodothermales bacterium]